MQTAELFRVAPEIDKLVAPGLAVKVAPVQVVLALGLVNISMPDGKLSVKVKPLTVTAAAFVRSISSTEVEGLPLLITEGVNDLFTPIEPAEATPNVAVTAEELLAPSAVVMPPAAIENGQLPPDPLPEDLVWMLKVTVQLPPPNIWAPLKVTGPLAGAVKIGAPAQVLETTLLGAI